MDALALALLTAWATTPHPPLETILKKCGKTIAVTAISAYMERGLS